MISHAPAEFAIPSPTTTPLARTLTIALASAVPEKAGWLIAVTSSELVHCGPIRPATSSKVSLDVNRSGAAGAAGATRSIVSTNSSDWALRLPGMSKASALRR